MKDRYAFLLTLKSLHYELHELITYAKECTDCYVLLKQKLDLLCRFILSETNQKRWQRWGTHAEILHQCERLRETSAKALCDMEKYQSQQTCNHRREATAYFSTLTQAVKQELQQAGVDCNSKVLFIGSGAFPASALTIAKVKQAQVMCLDIDREAVELARQVAQTAGLDASIQFASRKVEEESFVGEATHIIVASLVKEKWEVVDAVKRRMKPDAKIILRYGNGLKSIFNYPLEKRIPSEWKLTPIRHRKNVYDTIILQKAL